MHSDNHLWLRDQVDGARAQERERQATIVADLRAKLATAEADARDQVERATAGLYAKLGAAYDELHDLRIRAGLAGQGWQPLTEDDEPVRCACCDDDCNTEAWIEQGILCLEDADGMRVSFDLGEDYAFMRRAGIAAAAT